MRKRSCGECHACCVHVAVEGINKPAKTPCPHLKACSGGGCCSVYEHRPSECEVYSCGWLDGLLPANWRPDVCGILFEHFHVEWPYRVEVLTGFELRPGALDANRSLLRRIIPSGTVAMVVPFDEQGGCDDGSMPVRVGAGASAGSPQRGDQRQRTAGAYFDSSLRVTTDSGEVWFGSDDDVQAIRDFFSMCQASGSITMRMADGDRTYKVT